VWRSKEFSSRAVSCVTCSDFKSVKVDPRARSQANHTHWQYCLLEFCVQNREKPRSSGKVASSDSAKVSAQHAQEEGGGVMAAGNERMQYIEVPSFICNGV
jgi:hypothetical protein